jgi:hypothetical protein
MITSERSTQCHGSESASHPLWSCCCYYLYGSLDNRCIARLTGQPTRNSLQHLNTASLFEGFAGPKSKNSTTHTHGVICCCVDDGVHRCCKPPRHQPLQSLNRSGVRSSYRNATKNPKATGRIKWSLGQNAEGHHRAA